ncbi:hypothetical protein Srufu_027650 [Streptomyces libani subsp. rufus]|nr:hypothetical protein Srufu_027650 [Streptomyces libani subsp. rufus]
MRRSYKFLLRPTVGQQSALVAMLADHCELYNAALQERRGAWRHSSKTTVRYGDQSAQLKGIRAFSPEQARWSFSSQQATLRRLNKAFEAFFRRVKSGDTPGYPGFGPGHGSTRWSFRRTVTVAAGTPPRATGLPASASRVSVTFASTSTGRSEARSRR